ncbi:YopX family protein [Leuconostoc pseudomesenteroides]|uniref:YopX family protein n=1 Tax=Leuconostoc pseudomesenteroides TaxID=33968 RepID=UPI0021AB05C5|nr:YopX family protein [Leuconostoc pseudomesenteroides]
MRKIKFRAWEKFSEKWLDLEEYVIDPEDGAVGEVSGYEIVDVNYDAILEQYTGLKDKNGVEIYEGDIVAEITQFDDDEPDVYEVVYNETGDYPAFDLKGWTGEVNGISELSLTYRIEVIGNIHENPDLLEEQS